MMNIAENFRQVRQTIVESAAKANRDAKDIQLIAVSKTQPVEAIRAAVDTGQKDFGENYLQEAVDKIDQLRELSLTWHFLGPIQSNKTKAIAEHFHWVHSVERLKVAKRLSEQRSDSMPPLKVCLQVNIDNEPSKSGCSAEQAPELALAISQLPQINLRGLMAVPAPDCGVEPFLALKDLLLSINQKHSLHMDTLSMGMSADMDDAIAAGATMVRIGTALFGPRQTVNQV